MVTYAHGEFQTQTKKVVDGLWSVQVVQEGWQFSRTSTRCVGAADSCGVVVERDEDAFHFVIYICEYGVATKRKVDGGGVAPPPLERMCACVWSSSTRARSTMRGVW